MEQIFRAQVLLPYPFDHCYDYILPLQIFQKNPHLSLTGAIVEVPFGKKQVFGVIWDKNQSDSSSKEIPLLKTVTQIVNFLPLPLVHFIDWVARYTLAAKGLVLKMALHPSAFIQKTTSLEFQFSKPLTQHFNEEQNHAVQFLHKRILDQTFSVTLLDGITGSGKTEVYFSAIELAYKQRKQILILLPEISLTSQWLERFEKQFGILPFEWHSDVSLKKKRHIWHTLLNNPEKPYVVVGARSALFLPFHNLGLIIVDEEHEAAYKQEEGVLYHARDMAIVRAKFHNSPIILASATPSLETLYNIDQKRYHHLRLRQRHGQALLPEIYPIDMRLSQKKSQKREEFLEKESSSFKNKRWISEPLHHAIKRNLQKQEQILLFLNRRGYAPVTLCRYCGHRIECTSCSAALVDHIHFLICHLCGYKRRKETKCKECQREDSLIQCGPGVDRLQEEVQAFYPRARSVIISSDHLRNPKLIQRMINRIEHNEVDIIIGTQMIAKGHHFANLTLVGIIDADLSLFGGDPRAGEKTFQMLHQVSGRTGRAEKKGTVYLQTYQPSHPVMQALLKEDRENFLAAEKESREKFGMPPFGKLAALVLSGKNSEQVEALIRKLAQLSPSHPFIEIWGPVPAPLYLIRGYYRWRLLVKVSGTPNRNQISIQNYIRKWLNSFSLPRTIKIQIDIDPYSFF